MDGADKARRAAIGSRADLRSALFADLTMVLEDAVSVATSGQRMGLDDGKVEALLQQAVELVERSKLILARLRKLGLSS